MGNVKRSRSGGSGGDSLLAELVAADRKIEERQDSAILALMEHRWKAVKKHGYSMRGYSRALGHKSVTSVQRYVRGWEIWEARADHIGVVTPLDAVVMAGMSREQAEAATVVATVRNVGVGQVGRDAGYRRQTGRVRREIDEEAQQLVTAGSSQGVARRRAAARVAQREVIRINRGGVEELEPEPTAADLGADDFDPSESWADTLVIAINRKSRELSKHVKAWGLVLGSMPDQEALEYLEESERLIADLRAVMQERVQDEELS